MSRSSSLALCLVLAAAGCKSASTSSLICDPGCPTGTVCTVDGCVAGGALPDFTVNATDDGGSGCSPACAGGAPFCNDSRQCVACLVDRDCPLGQLCRKLGAASACLPGCTDESRCPAPEGGGGPAGCCDGQCVDLSLDPGNCGACGVACESAHAAAACVAGACAPGACDAAWADCNRDPSDGCETSLHSDPRSCGACGTVCSFPHAVAGCAGGCYVAACTFGWDDCKEGGDGCETNVLADAKSCGGCGLACPAVAHARNQCVNASCQLATCDVGFGDCDRNPNNGCEVPLFTDPANCGACGSACGQGLVCRNGGCTCPQCMFTNATSKCVNNVCVLDKCVAGFADCNGDPKDGCEIDTTSDAKSCAACGTACPMNLPVCKDSVCTDLICNDIGYAMCPTGAKQWCDALKADGNSSAQALTACNTCFFQNGMGQCQLSNGDCAGAGYSQFAQKGPTFGYQAGCSGASGRVWEYGSSFTTYGRWAP